MWCSSISYYCTPHILVICVTRFLSTVGSVKSFFALRLLAESDSGATHGHSVPDKEGIKLRLLVSPQTNFIVYDVRAKTTEVLTKTLSSRCMSLLRENVYLNFEFSVLRLHYARACDYNLCLQFWRRIGPYNYREILLRITTWNKKQTANKSFKEKCFLTLCKLIY